MRDLLDTRSRVWKRIVRLAAFAAYKCKIRLDLTCRSCYSSFRCHGGSFTPLPKLPNSRVRLILIGRTKKACRRLHYVYEGIIYMHFNIPGYRFTTERFAPRNYLTSFLTWLYHILRSEGWGYFDPWIFVWFLCDLSNLALEFLHFLY